MLVNTIPFDHTQRLLYPNKKLIEGIAAPIFNTKQEILTVIDRDIHNEGERERKRRGQVGVIFGKLENLGTYDCAAKEIREESGLDINPDHLQARLPLYLLTDSFLVKAHLFAVMTKLIPETNKLLPTDPDIESVQRMSFDELSKLPYRDIRPGTFEAIYRTLVANDGFCTVPVIDGCYPQQPKQLIHTIHNILSKK